MLRSSIFSPNFICPMPTILRVSADFVLGNAILRCLADEKLDIDRIRRLLDTAKQDATSFAGCSLEPALRHRLEIVLDRWARNPFDLISSGNWKQSLRLVQLPPFHLDLWQAQNVYYELLLVISREQLSNSVENGSTAFKNWGSYWELPLANSCLLEDLCPLKSNRRIRLPNSCKKQAQRQRLMQS